MFDYYVIYLTYTFTGDDSISETLLAVVGTGMSLYTPGTWEVTVRTARTSDNKREEKS